MGIAAPSSRIWLSIQLRDPTGQRAIIRSLRDTRRSSPPDWSRRKKISNLPGIGVESIADGRYLADFSQV
jgi:hypothetical protein